MDQIKAALPGLKSKLDAWRKENGGEPEFKWTDGPEGLYILGGTIDALGGTSLTLAPGSDDAHVKVVKGEHGKYGFYDASGRAPHDLNPGSEVTPEEVLENMEHFVQTWDPANR